MIEQAEELAHKFLIHKTALEAANKAKQTILDYAGSTKLIVDKELPGDIKLEIDRIAEKQILDYILKTFPDHSILSEESGIIVNKGKFVWIIDPLDGSVNFFHKSPHFSISISCYSLETPELLTELSPVTLYRHLTPFAGVIMAPQLSETYSAVSGIGVKYNGLEITTPPGEQMDKTIALINFSKRGGNLDGMPELLEKIIKKVRKVRSYGCTALDLAQMVVEKSHIYLQKGAHIWDFAAARIILEEAGCGFHAYGTDEENFNLVGSVSNLFSEIMEIALDCWRLPALQEKLR